MAAMEDGSAVSEARTFTSAGARFSAAAAYSPSSPVSVMRSAIRPPEASYADLVPAVQPPAAVLGDGQAEDAVLGAAERLDEGHLERDVGGGELGAGAAGEPGRLGALRVVVDY